ncbi:MAG: alpha/beta hydrolase, partial [Spirochaetales bacterium]|nr:alpha/beta hydrolase [Spirochaetales bacterium]
MKEHTLQSTNYTLHLKIFDHPTPKAVIKIIHGMTERQERYEDFAGFLAENGFIAVTVDMRGHGQYAPILSHIADTDGARLLVDDERVLRDWV